MDFQSRTEPPSPRRRERAEEEGQFALSGELTTGFVLFIGTLGLYLLARTLSSGLIEQVRLDLGSLPFADLSPGFVQNLFLVKAVQAIAIAGSLVGLLFLATLGVGLGQVGVHVNGSKLALQWERVFPFQFGRLVNWNNLMRGTFLLFKIAAIAVVAWWILARRGVDVTRMIGPNLGGTLAGAWDLVMRVALALAGTLLAIGVADYAYQRWRFERSLYMTRQELKEELKREEGNPQVRARIRKLQRENAQRKMYRDVKKATLVVTNPTHLAVALRYHAGVMAAPKVVAKGADLVAQRIMEIARTHGVPVVEKKPLAQALYKTVKIGQAIPLGLYLVVAELMAYVYRLRAGGVVHLRDRDGE